MSRDPAKLVAKAGRGDPNRDQHFLIDERVLDRLPGYLPGPVDHILEIGPGTGGLTVRLLDVAERVTVIERDRDLVEFLRTEFHEVISADRLTVIHGDALEVPLPEFEASVSNLPYGVSSQLLFRLLPERRPMVLTFQREFVDRLVADPGTPEYGRLSVTAGYYAQVSVAEVIPPSAFDPAPPIESAAAVFEPRSIEYEVIDESVFMDFVRALFTQRRKTVRNAIRNTTHISGITDPTVLLEAASDDQLSKRPGDLPPETFAMLSNVAVQEGIVE